MTFLNPGQVRKKTQQFHALKGEFWTFWIFLAIFKIQVIDEMKELMALKNDYFKTYKTKKQFRRNPRILNCLTYYFLGKKYEVTNYICYILNCFLKFLYLFFTYSSNGFNLKHELFYRDLFLSKCYEICE